jgi:hypothetical protein
MTLFNKYSISLAMAFAISLQSEVWRQAGFTSAFVHGVQASIWGSLLRSLF